MKCRCCKSEVLERVVDLGFAPPSNNYLTTDELLKYEVHFPLRINVCRNCYFCQTEDYQSSDNLFRSQYEYLSSTSASWLRHAEEYCQKIIHKLNLNKGSFVVELASNDGYLLRNFVNSSIPCLGVEPTALAASIARQNSVETLEEFFGLELSERLTERYSKADLIIANNVYAHVPNILDFTKGIANLLKPDGVVTIEFPHVMNMIKYHQFDTIYHEHFSYLSLHSVRNVFEQCGLEILDCEKIETHGGSLRVFGGLKGVNEINNNEVEKILDEETGFGLMTLDKYKSVHWRAQELKLNLLDFLVKAKKEHKSVMGFGAAAKASTLLNFAGVDEFLIQKIYDSSESKQGKFQPGTHIPICAPSDIVYDEPDYLIIFPWNIKNEIEKQVRSYGVQSKLITIIPDLTIYE